MRVVDFSDARTRRSFHVAAGISRHRTGSLPRLEAKGPRAGDAPAVSPPALGRPGQGRAGPRHRPSTVPIVKLAKGAYLRAVVAAPLSSSIKGVRRRHRPLYLKARPSRSAAAVRFWILQ